MTVLELRSLCRGYADLGGAAQAQLDNVLDGRPDDGNPNALAILRNWFQSVEAQSGNDEELMDDVGGLLVEISDALRRRQR